MLKRRLTESKVPDDSLLHLPCPCIISKCFSSFTCDLSCTCDDIDQLLCELIVPLVILRVSPLYSRMDVPSY